MIRNDYPSRIQACLDNLLGKEVCNPILVEDETVLVVVLMQRQSRLPVPQTEPVYILS